MRRGMERAGIQARSYCMSRGHGKERRGRDG